jgi:exopolysaccharide biosynthesis polyprenyl glycosylphosphotransferase
MLPPDVISLGQENNHRMNHSPGSSSPYGRSGQQPESGFGVRMREGSLSPRPFLLSSGTAWTALDFGFALLFAVAINIVTSQTQFSTQLVTQSLRAWLPFASLTVILGRLCGLYQLNVNPSAFVELLRIARAVAFAALSVYGLQKLWVMDELPNEQIARVSILTGAAMWLGRALWHCRRDHLYRRDIALRNYLIVGADEAGSDARQYIDSLRYSGYRFQGFISLCEPTDDLLVINQDEIAGGIHDVLAVARAKFIDEIIFSRRPATPGVLSQIIRQAQAMGLTIRLIPSLTEALIDRTDVQYIGYLPTISVFQPNPRVLSLFLKRTIDIVVAFIASILFLPLLVVIAVAIKLQSPGPVLYVSKRVGHKGRVFTCYKFRTMVEQAASMQPQLAHLNERRGILFKISNDPRITLLGAFLRKYSLDELPQLWNVLLGDMSLVGPRPPISSEVEQYDASHLRRLDAVPGMTGLWQVEARQDPSFKSYISLDSKYVNHWSLQLDLQILLRTVGVVLRGTGT